MDSFLDNEDSHRNIETRWDRIEKKLINSTMVYDHTNEADAICKNLTQNKEFIGENDFKALLGEKSERLCLDPNLVMNLRHSRVNSRDRSATSSSSCRQRAKSFANDRLHFQKMFELDREIQRYKKSLECIRPKTNEFSDTTSMKSGYSSRSLQNFALDLPSCTTNANRLMDKHDSGSSENECDVNENVVDQNYENDTEEDECVENVETTIQEVRDNSESQSLPPIVIPSQSLIDESYTTYGFDVQDQRIPTVPAIVSPSTYSSQTEFRTTVRPKEHIYQSSEDFEFIIKPMIMVNIQDSIRSSVPCDIESNQQKSHPKTTDFHRESKIAVNQQMSIFIKKLTSDTTSDNNSYMKESTEGNDIIKQAFDKKSQENFILLQKCFLRWIHFNTIEKLKRRNPAQTRIQKMEAFLRNITLERKRALNKLRHPANVVAPNGDDYKRMTAHDPHMESPRLLIRTYNNKLKTQQDIIELQKIKLARQQRIITQMKVSKLLDDTSEAEVHLKEELGLVAKNGCANSRSKAKCLQLASNIKEKDASVKSDLQAKGITAPKFLIEMQARALEREMRHQEAQRRREALDREKEALKIAAEEEKRHMDEEAKRERIKEYWRKRRLEKELEEKKAIERMRFLANLELAKSFNHDRLLKWALEKFKNIVKWKNRNKKVCNEFRRRLIYRDNFHRWRKYTARVWDEKRSRADACHNLHCKLLVWTKWQQYYLVAQSKRLLAEDWFHLRLTERVFRAWDRVTAQTRLTFEIKQKQADAHFNWYMKWKVLEHWRRLHAILKIEKETEARRERWRSKVYELIPDYTPNSEFI